MRKALYPKNDVDRLYVSWKEGWIKLTSIQHNIDALIQRLEHDIKNAGADWLQRPETIQSTQASTKKKNNQKTIIEGKTTL